MKKGGGKKTSPADYAPNFTTKRRRLLTQRFKTVPYPNYLGMKIKTVRAGHVTVSFKVSDNLKQYQGLLHGGAMTSIADTAASFAALTIIPPDLDLITVDIKGNFLAAVDKGVVTAEADVVHMGKRTSVIECSLYGPGRRLLWKGMFTCLHFPSEINITV